MNESAVIPSQPMSDAEYEKAIDDILAEIRRLQMKMNADRPEIERLKSETSKLKQETRLILTGMGLSL